MSMVYKCRHGVLVASKYCDECNKKPVYSCPSNSLGNRRPTIMKADKR